MTESARLIRVALVDADGSDTSFSRFLHEPLRIVVVDLEAAAGAARIGVAIPFPGSDLVLADFAIHLFQNAGLVRSVLNLVPIVIGGEVALRQRACRTGKPVDLIASIGHQPRGEDPSATAATFGHVALIVAQNLAPGNTGNHY